MISSCNLSGDGEVGNFGKSGLVNRRLGAQVSASAPPLPGAPLEEDFKVLLKPTLVSFSLNSMYLYVYVYRYVYNICVMK